MKKFYLMLAILVQVSVVFAQTHFKKGFIGAGYNQMSINIVGADIGGTQLDAGDEIAVFDGNLCVGVVELTQTIVPGTESTYAVISASADDGTGNGFSPGNKMYFRFWDSSAGTEYHNVIPIITDNGGVGTTETFVGDGTAFVNASTGSTTKTWTGAAFSAWNFDFNWSPQGIPEPNNDVVIPVVTNQPVIFSTGTAFCGSLTFSGDPTLTIQSDGSNTGSLIVAGDITNDAETVKAQRYMTGNAWHLISSPLSGQTAGDFLTDNSSIATNGSSRGMMDYDEAADDWSGFYQSTGEVDIIPLGWGYGIRTSADAAVTFTGSLSIGDVNAGVTASSNGWNLLGNPYPSAIYTKQEVFGFLVENDAMLNDSYKAIYLWDNDKAGGPGYSIINSGEGATSLASSQGFFIKAKQSGNVSFKQEMQLHKNDAVFKSAVMGAPNVVLKAKAGEIFASTKINFDEEMTLGLDPSYDAGILRSGKGFDIYSKLVEDNGVDFAIQWLPGNSSDSYMIPIGVDASAGGEIVFSAQTVDLPVGYEVMIEDRLTNSQTNIGNGELYVADLAANSNGVGRFYLHVGSSLQTGIEDVVQDDISVYTIDENLHIKGKVSSKAQFMIYSIDGRLMNKFGAVSQNLNKFSVAGYTPGIYFVKVQDENNYRPVKFVVGK